MRPRKQILVYGKDESRMSQICLVLACQCHFRMTRTVSLIAADRELRAHKYDAILVLGYDNFMVRLFKQLQPGIRVVVYASARYFPTDTAADRFVAGGPWTMAALIEALNSAVRKRGSKKGFRDERNSVRTNAEGDTGLDSGGEAGAGDRPTGGGISQVQAGAVIESSSPHPWKRHQALRTQSAEVSL